MDWDGDGLFDLVCGTEAGDVIFYKNTGEESHPDFSAKPEVLIQNKHNHRKAKEGDNRPHTDTEAKYLCIITMVMVKWICW
ncbi:hypothetical protein [Marinifilum fragile]|uniref:hypothetical protein n=1 Tax=Marinifilum fragile TaxID=570161 RepID=UPI002AAC35F3|nr:hypothetical protein [Marinifilum fragile]